MRDEPSLVGAPPAEDLRWFIMVPPSSGHGGDLPFRIWFMALRLLVRYSFWIRAGSIGSYSGLDGLGCLCRPGRALDRCGPFWGTFEAVSP